jgi:hypothetical protein
MESFILVKKAELKLLKSKRHHSLSEELVRAVIFDEDDNKIDDLVNRINRRAELYAVDTHKLALW